MIFCRGVIIGRIVKKLEGYFFERGNSVSWGKFWDIFTQNPQAGGFT
jgi:hypothetical protein